MLRAFWVPFSDPGAPCCCNSSMHGSAQEQPRLRQVNSTPSAESDQVGKILNSEPEQPLTW
jgi:hypothetical protein